MEESFQDWNTYQETGKISFMKKWTVKCSNYCVSKLHILLSFVLLYLVGNYHKTCSGDTYWLLRFIHAHCQKHIKAFN